MNGSFLPPNALKAGDARHSASDSPFLQLNKLSRARDGLKAALMLAQTLLSQFLMLYIGRVGPMLSP